MAEPALTLRDHPQIIDLISVLEQSGLQKQKEEVQALAMARVQGFEGGSVTGSVTALVIGVVGCMQGFRATSSAESVGFLTTVAVVESIFIVILLDAMFAIFFTTIGV